MDVRRRPDVVVLAAGRSSRMGEPKGLVEHDGRRWIECQLDLLATVAERILVVLGLDRERYLEALPDLSRRARMVVNPDPDRGPFSSLQCGLAEVRSGASVFVLPVDVPAAGAGVWRALDDALVPPHDAAVPDLDGRGGHPVLLSPAFVASLRAGPSEGRLDAALARARVVRVPVKDPRIRLNLNAREDWGKLTGRVT